MNNPIFKIFVKQVFTEEELKLRLKKKASRLKNGQASQFFINGKPRYLFRKNDKFEILKDRPDSQVKIIV